MGAVGGGAGVDGCGRVGLEARVAAAAAVGLRCQEAPVSRPQRGPELVHCPKTTTTMTTGGHWIAWTGAVGGSGLGRPPCHSGSAHTCDRGAGRGRGRGEGCQCGRRGMSSARMLLHGMCMSRHSRNLTASPDGRESQGMCPTMLPTNKTMLSPSSMTRLTVGENPS